MPGSLVNEPSDEALMRAIAAGDQQALRSLNQRYGHALAVVADRILSDRTDAEEVAADVLWQVWRQAVLFDRTRGSVGAWLMMLVRSRAIDRLRTRTSREAVARADAASFVDDPVPDPAGALHSAERRKVVGAALATLAEGERTVLELAYFSDLSQSAIAEKTGLPLGTVKSRIRSAMIKLKEALKPISD
ncbi:MAG: sigma-70 family RNA polymerase sigma factor [Candidatus Binataceae bacterium]